MTAEYEYIEPKNNPESVRLANFLGNQIFLGVRKIYVNVSDVDINTINLAISIVEDKSDYRIVYTSLPRDCFKAY